MYLDFKGKKVDPTRSVLLDPAHITASPPASVSFTVTVSIHVHFLLLAQVEMFLMQMSTMQRLCV